jgi:hypothetical protein
MSKITYKVPNFPNLEVSTDVFPAKGFGISECGAKTVTEIEKKPEMLRYETMEGTCKNFRPTRDTYAKDLSGEMELGCELNDAIKSALEEGTEGVEISSRQDIRSLLKNAPKVCKLREMIRLLDILV